MSDRLVARHRLLGDNGEEPHRRSVWPGGSGHLVGDLSQSRQCAVRNRAGRGEEHDDIDGVLPVIERMPPTVEVSRLDRTGFPRGMKKNLGSLTSAHNNQGADKAADRHENRKNNP
jgi:hypothetical protein